MTLSPEAGQRHEREVVGVHRGAVWNKVVQQRNLDILPMQAVADTGGECRVGAV